MIYRGFWNTVQRDLIVIVSHLVISVSVGLVYEDACPASAAASQSRDSRYDALNENGGLQDTHLVCRYNDRRPVSRNLCLNRAIVARAEGI